MTGSIVRVANTDLEDLRAQILDGSRFQVSGVEQPVFLYPIRPIDEGDFEDPPANSGVFSVNEDLFPYAPLFQSGMVVVEWEEFYEEPRRTIIEQEVGTPEALLFWTQGPDRSLPVFVKDVRREGSFFRVEFHDLDGVTRGVTLIDVMKEGSVTTEFEFEGHPEGWAVTNVPETRQSSSGLGLTGFFPAPAPNPSPAKKPPSWICCCFPSSCQPGSRSIPDWN